MKNKLRVAYIIADVLSALVVWTLFLLYRWKVNDALEITSDRVLSVFNFYLPLFLYPLACLTVHYLAGYYVNPYKKTAGVDFVSAFVSSVPITLLASFTFIINDTIGDYVIFYNSAITLFCIQFLLTFVFRVCITNKVRKTIKQGKMSFNVAIVGCSHTAQKLANEVEDNLFGHKIVGYISTKYDTQIQIEESNIVGQIEDIEQLKLKYNIHSVIIANEEDTDEAQLYEIISQLYPHSLEIRFTPRIYEILTGTAQINKLNLSPLVNITESSMPDWQMSFKRLADVLLSSMALLVCSPLILYFAIRVKLDSPGSVFYLQERIGRLGKPFQIIKFRTMYDNSENGTPQLSKGTDGRVTRYGYFLRKYRIDEIPQFWNVLKGEMSLVGPRPERAYFIEKITQQAPYYCLIYRIRPGLTSWGPIKIGYSDTVDKMIKRLNYDMIYMDNMSIANDIKILLYTIEVLVKGKGQ